MKKQISTKNAPQAIGPYSQAISVNGFLFISGQLGVTPAGEFAGSSVEAQTEQSLENLKNILAEAGLNFDNTVKTTIFLADPYPARSTVAVKTLPKDALVEIELIAAY